MQVAPEIILTDEERGGLMKLVSSKLTSVRLEQRAGIVLLAADGLQNKDIAQLLGIGRVRVARWRQRYAQHRLAGIERDLPRGGAPVRKHKIITWTFCAPRRRLGAWTRMH